MLKIKHKIVQVADMVTAEFSLAMFFIQKLEDWLVKNEILKHESEISSGNPDETDNPEAPKLLWALLPVEVTCNRVSGKPAFLWLKTLWKHHLQQYRWKGMLSLLKIHQNHSVATTPIMTVQSQHVPGGQVHTMSQEEITYY